MFDHRLEPHRDFLPAPATQIQVYGDSDGRSLVVTYVTQGEVPCLPGVAASGRADGLWRTTCFEMFLQNADGAYVELNFSPSTRWAAYLFARYRKGRSDLPMPIAPLIEPIENGIRVQADISCVPGTAWRMGLSAVIEAKDGSKSYWALAHAPGPPDFHNPDCFIATLPAPATP